MRLKRSKLGLLVNIKEVRCKWLMGLRPLGMWLGTSQAMSCLYLGKPIGTSSKTSIGLNAIAGCGG
ncbi:MAG: hypothetical protein ACKESB_00540 [Candidatus Hodgkinia cicadicola]